MTRTEALVEAKRRWGVEASIHMLFSTTGFLWWKRDVRTCAVSSESMFSSCATYGGYGPTWEASFADADRRAQEARDEG